MGSGTNVSIDAHKAEKVGCSEEIADGKIVIVLSRMNKKGRKLSARGRSDRRGAFKGRGRTDGGHGEEVR